MKHLTLTALMLCFIVHISWTQCNPIIDLGGATNPFCSNDNTVYNLAITGTNVGISSGTWAGWSGAAAGGASSAMFNPAIEGFGQYDITWTVTVADGDCMIGEQAALTIFVDGNNSGLIPTYNFSPTVGCVGGSIQITGNPTFFTFSVPVFNFSIDVANTDAPGANVDATGNVTVTGPGTVVVLMTETNACNTSLPIEITMIFEDDPDLVASPVLDTICDGYETDVLLTTNYYDPNLVEFWLTDLTYSSGDLTAPVSILNPGVVGDIATSTFLPGAILNEILVNNSDEAQTATYTLVPTGLLSDGSLCEGDPVVIEVTVMPTPNISIISNNFIYCSGDTLDFTISTTTMGGGVTFDLIIEESEEPNSFPADLEDDQMFPIIIPELVAAVGVPIEVSDLATFIMNKTGNYDPGRIILGMLNVRLTDYPDCQGADVLPTLVFDQTAIIYPEPELEDVADLTICSGETVEIDLSQINEISTSLAFNEGYPSQAMVSVITSTNDAGITGASGGTVQLYDSGGIELSMTDISQTLSNSGTVAETATYTIVPVGAGFDGSLNTPDDCFGDTLTFTITVNPELDAVPDPVNPEICTGDAFSVEMLTTTTPANGIGDIEFLVTAITNTPNLGQGTTIIPNVTVLDFGQFLSETLNNPNAGSESATYTIRPQLTSSRTNPGDPTTATCFGAEVDITVDVLPLPMATAMAIGSDTLCPDESRMVEGMATGTMPFTHLWEIANPQPPGYTGTGTLDGAQSSPNATAEFIGGNPGNILLQYSATDGNGCGTVTVDVEMLIEDLPLVEILGGDLVLCQGGPIEIITGVPTDDGGIFTINPDMGMTDLGDGTAEFDPAVAAAGNYELVYSYAPPGVCAHTDTISIEVELCAPQISITDPCTCRESTPGSQGNATTLNNGQFTETVEVTAPSGQTWYIAEVIGLYDVASPNPPLSPVPFNVGPAGVTLVENPAGLYILEGIHVDGQGYTIALTNGTDTVMTSNTCYYPNPVIEDLEGGYCFNAAPVPLVGHANPSSGNGVFNIYTSGGVLAHANATELDPGFLGIGTYDVVYTFDEDDNPAAPCQNCNPGCVQAISQEVKIVPTPNGLTCNAQVNVTLDTNCEAIILPDMILEGNYPSFDIFNVEVFEGSISLGDTLTGAQIGKVLTAIVTDECLGMQCWGNILVEDKFGPVFTCPDTLRVPCSMDISNIAIPEVIDNCDGILIPDLVGEVPTNFGCGNADGVVRRVLRVWQAIDNQGNTSTNCNQIIEFMDSDLSDVVFPPNWDNTDTTAFDCNDYTIDPDVTGWPTVEGFPLDEDNYCSLNVLSSDDVIGICDGSFKVLRTWTVFDWCAPSGSGNPLIHTQVIKILDTTAPQITCPDDLTIGMGGSGCESFGIIPAATVIDDCSTTTEIVFTPQGNIAGNGGLLAGLDLGFHTVTYQTTDDCGNVASCTTTVAVTDDVPPTPICDEFTIVSLANADTTFSMATTFDDGSYDNCDHLPITFSAKRMDDPGNFGPLVGFTCDDVGTPVAVILKVTDYFGNENTCMVVVEVQSANSPLIACPPDITIDCTDDLQNFTLIGMPTVGGNCASLSNLPSDNMDSLNTMCGVGFVIRTWTLTDVIGAMSSCAHTINVIDNNPVTIANISWPEDTTITGCQTSFDLAPTSLPSSPVNYSEPIVDNIGCGLNPAASFDDSYFPVADSACFKIIREWTVIDWCQFMSNDTSANPVGQWTHQQVIKVIDTEAPILTDCDDRTFMNETLDCSDIAVDLSITIDDCADSTFMVVTYEVDIFNDGVGPENTGSGMDTLNLYPLGTHSITYSVNDQCGNTSTCSFLFTIEDGLESTISCQGTNIEIMPSVGMIDVPVTSLSYSVSDNCSDTSALQISYSSDVLDTLRTYDCDSIGANLVEIWVTDEAGNQDFCVTQLLIQDNMNVCDDTLVVIAGGIYNEEDEPINLVDISINGTGMATTGNDGVFDFQSLQSGQDYTLIPEKDLDLLNGVTTFDMALISKHVLNIKKLDSPYKIIAADVNNSGSVTTFDLVVLRKAVLHITDNFLNNTSWRFVDNNYDFPDPTNPFYETFPEFVNYNNLTHNAIGADFVAIKVGDVNGSANPADFANSDDRSEMAPFVLQVEDRMLEKGEVVSLDFFPKEESSLLGFQFTMEYNQHYLEFEEVIENGLVRQEHFGTSKLEEGLILSSWNQESQSNPEVSQKASLFSLSFTAKESGLLSDYLDINSQVLKSEAYESLDNNEQHPEVALEFVQGIKSPDLVLYQNHPNPFEEQTMITFNLPKATFVTLKIFNHSGSLIKTISGDYEAGLNRVALKYDELRQSGIMIYQLETELGILSKKMLRLP